MTMQDRQAEVLAFLADPATHGGHEIKRIDTHAAAVFLAGPRAYKVKRAVRYPFLDFSTLEQRKAACDAELLVNRRFAPRLYISVVPITRERSGALALDGAGTPVEWAVAMARFDESATLDHLAERGAIDLALADTLARAVAAAHTQAPIADGGAWPATLAHYVTQNDGELRGHPDLFAPEQVDALTQASRAALQRLDPLLRARARAGLVRRGHGDLHLGNIVLIEGKPVIFDAIEFDENIATGDVLYDLAFLLMDLVNRGLDGAANVALNRYLAATRRDEDLDGLAALPLLLAVRAAIRAKVTAAKRGLSASGRDAIADAARGYFDLARRSITPPAPVLVAIGGHSGTGKSLLARALAPFVAPLPGAVVLRSDVERKRMFGVGETERLAPDAYREQESARVYATLAAKARRVTAAGHSAIVDAVFAMAGEREQIAAVAQSTGAAFCPLFLAADLAVRIARVTARRDDASDATPEVVRAQDTYALGDMDWTKIDAAGTPDETLAAARAALVAAHPGSGAGCIRAERRS